MASAPVVFVHGFIGTLQVPDLAGHFQNGAIAPDLLGYGSSADVAASEVNLHNQVARLTIQAGTGHMMMLEDTPGFVSILRGLLEEPAELAIS